MKNNEKLPAVTSDEPQWHQRSVESVLKELGTAEAGLSASEAGIRLAADGPNVLHEGKRINPLMIFLRQFKSLIIWILIGAGALSFFLGERVDAFAILAIVMLNAVIGFVQEFNSERSIAALKKMTAPQANVLRGGQTISIAASQVVRGDVLVLAAGDMVSADARLFKVASLTCVESPLTGESVPAEKKLDEPKPQAQLGDRTNMVFMGTSVAGGTALAVVVAVGMRTELGRIAALIESSEEEGTPLEKKLGSFGNILIWSTLGIVLLLFGLGFLRGTDLFELFMTSVSLAVAAVPESLPAVVTVALALGVRRMSRRGALIRKLSAVETLGSTSVICTDKTGTLTLGEMTVRSLYVPGTMYEVTGEGYGPEGEVQLKGATIDAAKDGQLHELSTILVGCNTSQRKELDGVWSVIGDPTEGAMLTAGMKAGADRDALEKLMPKIHELPFDSDRKRSSTVRSDADGKFRVMMNGAPGPLLECCSQILTKEGIRSITEQDRTEILANTSDMAKRALRVLASSYRTMEKTETAAMTVESVEKEMVFSGLCGMYDPPRNEAKDSVAQCRKAGIRVVMITGDHAETAAAIAREIGIETEKEETVTGEELEKLSDDELIKKVPAISVYARVTAEHKLRIIRAWRSNDAVVAMTGDGVNDAAAIKGADIGIAMGRTGTEVTKQASDMIITDDNFTTIKAAVEEGRGIYDNIIKTLQYLLAGNTAEIMLMGVCVAVGLPMPLLPIHLLWVNLVTDGLPALCLAADPIDPDVMDRAPRKHAERIAGKTFFRSVLITGALTAFVSLSVYLYVLEIGTVSEARTAAFTVLVFAELLRSFGARSAHKPLWKIPFFSNLPLVSVVLFSIAIQIVGLHNEMLMTILKTTSVPLIELLFLFLIGSIPLIVLEILKHLKVLRPETAAPPAA